MTVDDAAPATAAPEVDATRAGPSRRGGRRVPLLAHAALLLGAYLALSLVNDPSGFLGTDTGGKVLTLEAMAERGSATDVDVGYWAERWDPDGDLHPHFGTQRIGDSWVQVTTLPMIVAASPLYEAGGYRLALLLPMLGGVACAAAAHALARRSGGDQRDATTAFWLVGLGGPVLLYSLDLWEHTLGLAAMAWAVVLLLDARAAAPQRGVVVRAGAAGLLTGLAFAMRTEGLLFGATTTAAVALAVLVADRRPVRAVALGLATIAGVGVGVVANGRLEAAVLGDGLRTGRAGSAAAEAGAGVGERLREGLVTTFAPLGSNADLVLGVVAVGLLALLVVRGRGDRPASERLPLLAVATVAAMGAHALLGLHFVPGLLVAAPVAVVGLALGRRGPAAPLWWAAVGTLPVVWAFQYVGGATAQWGGRYVLLSGLLLTVMGVVALPELRPVAGRTALGLAVAVTAFGLAWMSVRTHDAAAAAEAMAARPEPVLVAHDSAKFFPREVVAEAGDREWLVTLDDEELERAAEVVLAAGHDHFAVVTFADGDVPAVVGDFTAGAVETVPFLPDLDLEVTTFRR